MSEVESMSEKELATQLFEEVFSSKPKSVGEAIAAQEPEAPLPQEEEPPPAPPSSPEEPPVVVEDKPPAEADTTEGQPEPEVAAEPEPEPEEEPEEEDTHVAWAKKTFGEEPAAWAKAAYEREQHIGRLSQRLNAAEQNAVEWYEYSQGVEQQAQRVQTQAMPLSSQEEMWVENSLADPLTYAMQAAFSGNLNLYNGVIAAVAEQDPTVAAQIGTQVQMALVNADQEMQRAQAEPQPDIRAQLQSSVQRLGIDVPTYGDQMMKKIEELGVGHPFVDTILNGNESARDVALLAVLDLVRTGSTVTRKVQEDERAQAIRREAELRKEAAGVVTGAPHVAPQKKEPTFVDAMTQEWRQRGQWSADEG